MLRDGLLLLGGDLALGRHVVSAACVRRAESWGECYSADMSATRSLLVEYECDTPGYSLSMSARDGATQHSYS